MEKGIIVHAIVYSVERKVLIIKRAKANDVLPEDWDIPGGTLEDGEDPVIIEDESTLLALQDGAFNVGVNIEAVLFVGAIYFRDLILPSYRF